MILFTTTGLKILFLKIIPIFKNKFQSAFVKNVKGKWKIRNFYFYLTDYTVRKQIKVVQKFQIFVHVTKTTF